MSQFGIQMYTLRETMKTPEDYETTLRWVAEMGYTNVQLTPPAFSGAEDTQRLLEKYGLAADSAICGVYQIPERLDQIEKTRRRSRPTWYEPTPSVPRIGATRRATSASPPT